MAFSASSVLTILESAADSPHVATLRAALLIGLDFAFFNRGDSAFPITADDLVEEGDFILFRETRFKRKRADSLLNRVRRFNAARVPTLQTCLRNYRALRAADFASMEPPPFI